jgi:hypothetical protein
VTLPRLVHKTAPTFSQTHSSEPYGPDQASQSDKSQVELERTMSTWPQVSADVALGATTIAEAVRRLGLGEDLPSGRTRVDVGRAVNQLDEPQMTIDRPPPPAEYSDPALPGVPGMITAAAIRAPSASNAQPWHVETGPDVVTIRLAAEHTSTLDIGLRASAVALGAALFNAKVAAAAQHVLGPVSLLSDVAGVPLQATLHLRDGGDPDLAALYEPMLARETNRRAGTPRAISADTIFGFDATSDAVERGHGSDHRQSW